jgi:uncharacterized protein (DUF1800 family)
VITRRHLLFGGGIGLLALTGCGPQQAVDLVLGVEAPEAVVNRGATLDLPAHVLRRLTFGEHPDDRAALLALAKTPDAAVEAWVVRQLHPETIDDSVCERLIRRREALAEPLGELYEFKERVLLHELTAATLLRAVYSQRQLHEQLCHFWNDHFNVDMSKGECAWVTVAYDRDVIRPHALGRFSDLLRAVALSPAMLWYLDGRVNRVDGTGDKATKPNENYARELLELHTLGVDGGYTQQDVMEVARCLSGWTVRDQHQWRKGLVEFHRDAHDDGAKTVLGQTIAAGGGERDLDQVLRIVSTHPSTARYVARKLCTRFIADDPPSTVIDHVAQAFTVSNGDLALTMRALINSDAFRDPTRFATKLKRPFHYVASCLRATAAQSNAGNAVIDYLGRLGHLPFQFPTPDGQPENAEAWTGTLLWRWRFAGAFARGGLAGTRVDADALVKRFGSRTATAAHLFARQPTTKESDALTSAGANALAIALGSPGFQRC